MLALPLGGCDEDIGSRSFAESTTGGTAGLLPGPPADEEVERSGYEPENPHREIATGLLRQTAFEEVAEETEEVAAGSGLQMEAHNLLVGPGRSSEETSFSGGAVFEVRSGSGTVTIGQETRDIATGSTFAVSEGESVRFENSSTVGLALRVYLIRQR